MARNWDMHGFVGVRFVGVRFVEIRRGQTYNYKPRSLLIHPVLLTVKLS